MASTEAALPAGRYDSYGAPYWPDERLTLRDNARLGPLRNDAGMWLTATSYRRSQMTSPTPEGLKLPLPKLGDLPNRIMGTAPNRDETGEMYWYRVVGASFSRMWELSGGDGRLDDVVLLGDRLIFVAELTEEAG